MLSSLKNWRPEPCRIDTETMPDQAPNNADISTYFRGLTRARGRLQTKSPAGAGLLVCASKGGYSSRALLLSLAGEVALYRVTRAVLLPDVPLTTRIPAQNIPAGYGATRRFPYLFLGGTFFPVVKRHGLLFHRHSFRGSGIAVSLASSSSDKPKSASSLLEISAPRPVFSERKLNITKISHLMTPEIVTGTAQSALSSFPRKKVLAVFAARPA
jgi:hypothetical protein